MMEKRPLDFYGPEDYTGGDFQDDINRIVEKQKAWDEEYSKLSSFRKLILFFRGIT